MSIATTKAVDRSLILKRTQMVSSLIQIILRIFEKNFFYSRIFVDKCQFHPGNPIFHDAYKGWSCCNKKSTDFTEFLNFKGCTTGKHSNEKPAEPEKPKLSEQEIEEQIRKQEAKKTPVETVERPAFDSPCETLESIINPSFKQQMDQIDLTKKLQASTLTGEIAIGTTCKNGGCKGSYTGTAVDDSGACVYHPGVPIFHEGYKFWSCCQKKTSDFQAFLDQVGCETGKHKWRQDANVNKVNCRWDWHQTPSNVVIAVYAKNYDYKKSFVKLNPVRLMVKIIFPLESNAEFNIDIELRGIVDVKKASAKMFGTKIEITLPKLHGGQWVRLDIPREVPKQDEQKLSDLNISSKETEESKDDENDSDVDLDDLEIIQGAKISELAQQTV